MNAAGLRWCRVTGQAKVDAPGELSGGSGPGRPVKLANISPDLDSRTRGLEGLSIAEPLLRPDRTRLKPEVGAEYFFNHRRPAIWVSKPIPSVASVLAIDSLALLIVPVNARTASIVSGMTIA